MSKTMYQNRKRGFVMKKILSLLMAVAMMVTVLAACGGNDSGSGDAGTTPPDSAVAEDTNTVAVGAVVIARDDVPEADIYDFVSTIFENKDAITEQHAKGGELDLDFASSVTSVPYHPGAAKYFAEKGKDVAAVKDGAGAGDSKALTFGTGGESGTYYGFGGVLSSYVSNNTGVSVTAVTSGGSKANIEDLAAGDVQLGFVQSDVMSYAYNGERLFDSAVNNFSVVAALYMEQVQIVTTNPDIKSVADLAGKSVSIGDRGSGVWFNAVDVLGAYDIDPDSGISPVYQGFGDSAESLKDGKIDAAFVVAGAPTTAVTTLAASRDVYLVSLDDEHIEKLIAASPYYSKNVISKDAYGTPEDVTTVAVGAVVIARNDVSDADVYNFLYGVFENIDTLGHDKAKELSLEFASSVTAVPYHPGAVAYFADKGITVK